MSWLEDLVAPRVFAEGIESTPRRGAFDFSGLTVADDPSTGRKKISVPGVTVKATMDAATTAALPANTRTGNVLQANANGALAAQDGVALVVGNRLLVKDEASPLKNGWYDVTSLGSGSTPWILTRTTDGDTSTDFVNGSLTRVLSGLVNGGKWFSLTVVGGFVLNTNDVVFTQYFPTSQTHKDAVRVATNGALLTNTRSGNTLTASANGSINQAGAAAEAARDNVTLALNDRILVKNEATGANNGIYRVTDLGSAGTPWKLERAPDAASSEQVPASTIVPVSEGTTWADKTFRLTTNAPITLNTTTLTFALASVGGAAGASGVVQTSDGAGGFTGATGITVVGGTGLLFGSGFTAPGGGLLQIGRGQVAGLIVLLAGRNAADSGTANLMRWGAFNDNQFTLGENTNCAIVSLRSSTTVDVFTGGVQRAVFSATALDLVGNALVFGSQTGLSKNGTDIYIGDDTNVAAVRARFATGGRFYVHVNGTAEWSLDATEMNCTNNNIVQGNAADASALSFLIRGAGSTSGNTAGGSLVLRGGRRAGTGDMGRVEIQLNQDDSVTFTMVEATHLANARKILSLVRGSTLTTTQMPANTGDLVIYIANAGTNPSANAVGGGILYSDAGALKWRGSGGTTTTLGAA